LRSPLSRAVVPVAAGLGFFALIALILWGIAALISHDDAATDRLTGRTFQPGPAKLWADIVAEDGPVIFPDLLGTDGDKTVVLDHVGSDPLNGFTLYLAHPADRPITCKVTQVHFTRTFSDCEGRTIDITALAAPPAGVAPVVSPGDGTLTLDLTPDSATATTVGTTTT
jgi:hypothetical protein